MIFALFQIADTIFSDRIMGAMVVLTYTACASTGSATPGSADKVKEMVLGFPVLIAISTLPETGRPNMLPFKPAPNAIDVPPKSKILSALENVTVGPALLQQIHRHMLYIWQDQHSSAHL